MSGDAGVRERLLAIFRVEAREHLQALAAHLLTLEREPGAPEANEAVEGIFRATHTLKGAARSVGLDEIEAPCQAVESVMSRLVRGEAQLSRPLVQLLQNAVAHLARSLTGAQDPAAGTALIARLEAVAAGVAPGAAQRPAAGAPAGGASPAAAAGAATEETIRVSTVMLDAFLFRAEDLSAAKLAAAERAAEAGGLAEAMAAARKSTPAASDLRSLAAMARTVATRLGRDAQALGRTVDVLRDELRHIRMAPASTVLDLIPLMVRDLCRETGKEVDLSVQGADLQLDRRVLEAVKDPLIHLVRNAVDHGIERPEARAAAGKPPRGGLHLCLTAREGGRIEIRLADDGAGLDLNRVKAAAVRARLITAEEAEALPDAQAEELIFRFGVSTSPIITRVSGRGLGMSIVRERVERLGGALDFHSRPGRGTTVTMVLPASIATFHGLLVRAGRQPFIVPLDAIQRTCRVASAEIVSLEGRPSILRDGSLIPCAWLRALLQLEGDDDRAAPEQGGYIPCVIVTSGEDKVALLADEIVGAREVLAKELAPPLVRVRNVAGAGLLGNGEVVMLLRPADLVRCGRQGPRVPARRTEATRREPVVLVVDDSITTRTVEKNLLEVAGFRVRVAADGIEAWQALAGETYDLVVSDVNMPGMDGFELTERIRAHPLYKELPIVLVTALESREDKEKGIRLGANAYVFKSGLAESNLLEIIRRLV